MAEHVFRRGARYYYRRRIPVDLVERFGKVEHVQALGTADPKKAAEEGRRAGVALDEKFARMRVEIEAEEAARASAEPLLIDTAPYRTLQHISRAEIEHDEQRNAEDGARYVREQNRDELREIITDAIRDPNFLGSLSETLGAVVAPISTPQSNATDASALAHSDRSLTMLARRWEKLREPEGKTAAAFHRMVARFHEHVGRIVVPRINKMHVVTFRDKLLDAGVGLTAVDQSLNQLRTLLAFAIGQAWIDTNPAEGVKREGKKKHSKTARPPFDRATLSNIFTHPIYTEGMRPHQGRGDASYWLPLLGLFAGARVEEITQLSPGDVYQETYRTAEGSEARCWVVRFINSEELGQGVKNQYSHRRIPLHPYLVALGFPAFASARVGAQRVFEGMSVDKYGRESSTWSNWWNREVLRRQCAPTDSRMVFHSFRHTFKDVCRENGITKELSDALQGHSEGDASSDYGGEFYPLRPLVEAMSRYKVHGVNLPGKSLA